MQEDFFLWLLFGHIDTLVNVEVLVVVAFVASPFDIDGGQLDLRLDNRNSFHFIY